MARLLPILIMLLFAGTATAQDPNEQFTPWGRTTIQVPERSDDGDWDGTWWYSNRDFKIALWIETAEGKPRVKLRYLSLNSPEGFETDWNGDAQYDMGNAPGIFALNMKQRDRDTIAGRWEWALTGQRSVRREEGDYTIYRAGDGRHLVIQFHRLEKVVESGGQTRRSETSPTLSFRKASKRQVLWDELPF